jgi:radical SAM superfamily enzyme YgiQ (UPF0313 family)
MRIAFITPSLFSLAPMWRSDPQIVKLATPTLSGFMRAHGYDQIRQYDFEVQVFNLEDTHPGQLNLTTFFDDVKVDEFLTSDNAQVRKQAELICDALEIEEAELYAFSCASALEIMADMHAAGNINMCMSKILKERFPKCKTVIGGLQISPESRQRGEYESMLERCDALDYVIEGKGEYGLVYLVQDLDGYASLKSNGVTLLKHGHGNYMPATYDRPLHVPKGIAKQEGILTEIRQVETPEEKPEGSHERREIVNPSLHITPYFDPKNIEERKMSGIQILKRYNLDESWVEKMVEFHDDSIVVLPGLFIEGCNSQCTFCGYSMSKMAKREITDVIRGLAYLREKYDARYFHFLNTNINGYYKYAETFCDELINAKLDILWSDCANLWALDEKLIHKMRESGAVRFTFGVECPSDKMLKYVSKGITRDKVLERLKMVHDAGIWNHVLLITGLPHETVEDTKDFVDFLEETADWVHGYSISSFYLISTSLMGAFPERYGLDVITSEGTLLEDAAFNEVDGLPWSVKQKQIVESTQIITEAIRRIKKDPKYWSGAIDLELIFWLYDRLGHDNKQDIVQAYEQAFIGAPAHAKSYAPALREILANPNHPANQIFKNTPWQPALERITIHGEAMHLPINAGDEEVQLEFRCNKQATQVPTVTAGRALGAHLSGERPKFADALDVIIAPNSRFEEVVKQVGWTIVSRGESSKVNAFGFKIEKDDCQIELMVERLAKDQPAAVREGNFGFSYVTPRGQEDPTKDPDILRFIMRMGGFVLKQLATSDTSSVEPISPSLVEEFAKSVISTLEEPYQDTLNQEERHLNQNSDYEDPRPGNWGPGERHGNKYSMVTAG